VDVDNELQEDDDAVAPTAKKRRIAYAVERNIEKIGDG
jgi:hypothetical protein